MRIGSWQEPARCLCGRRLMTRSTVATRWNLDALEDAYRRWLKESQSVDPSWQSFFEGFELGSTRTAAASLDTRGQTGIVLLIQAYRDLGHFVAHLDPLSEPRRSHPL